MRLSLRVGKGWLSSHSGKGVGTVWPKGVFGGYSLQLPLWEFLWRCQQILWRSKFMGPLDFGSAFALTGEHPPFCHPSPPTASKLLGCAGQRNQ